MDYSKDIVLIIGQNAVGKTTAIRYLSWIAEQRGIVYEPKPISDFFFLLNQTLMDDKLGGFRHYHSWSQCQSSGHSHANGEPTIPFAVTHNDLVDGMQRELLQTITLLPRFEKLQFVEWTGGINTNPPEESVSQVDFSFYRISKKLKEDLLALQWIERVRAVIHISAETTTRFFLNTKDSNHRSSRILSGQASARRISTVLQLFGHDDFSKIEPFFKKAGVRFIFNVCNKGDHDFYKDLRRIGGLIF
jgi:ABC-type cobalamin/Fe3+-siderophores transport system ATPase subunit